MNSDKKTTGTVVIAVALIGALFMGPMEAGAATCNFNRSLYVGVTNGLDVHCLQSYLNDNGYLVAQNGVGSPGNETTIYGSLTKEAVFKWQLAHGVAGANGVFGPGSRAKYEALINTSGEESGSNSDSTSSDASLVSNKIQDLLESAIIEAENAHKMIDESDDSEKSERYFSQSLVALFDSLFAFFDGDNAKVLEGAGKAIIYAKEAQENITNHGSDRDSVDKEDAREALDEAQSLISKADDEIYDAHRDGVDIDEAQDLFDDAEDEYDDAEDEYDDQAYKQAHKRARKALDLAQEAIDILGNKADDDYRESKSGARNAIRDAHDSINDADDEIDKAYDDYKDIDDAQDLLDDAEEELRDAQDEYDDGDWARAITYAVRATSKAQDAIKALDDSERGSKTAAGVAIDEAERAIDRAQDDIDEAYNNYEDIDRAEELHDEAQRRFHDARDEYDDKDYRKARDLAREAEDLADDARRAL